MRTDFGRREAPTATYVRYLVKKVKDKPKSEKTKTVRNPRILLLWQKLCVKRHQRQFTVGLYIEHIGDIIETNLASRPWYDAVQSPLGSVAEAHK